MRRRLGDILISLSENIESTLEDSDVLGSGMREYYGQVETFSNEDGESYPVEKTQAGEGRQISPDDNYALQVYYKLINQTRERNNDEGFGSEPEITINYQVQLIGIGLASLLGLCDSEEVAGLVADAIPRALDQQEYIDVSDINSNYLEVVESEFSGQNLDHLITDAIAFSIDINIQKIIC